MYGLNIKDKDIEQLIKDVAYIDNINKSEISDSYKSVLRRLNIDRENKLNNKLE